MEQQIIAEEDFLMAVGPPDDQQSSTVALGSVDLEEVKLIKLEPQDTFEEEDANTGDEDDIKGTEIQIILS